MKTPPVLTLVIAPGCEPAELRYDANDFNQTQALVGGAFEASRLSENVSLYSHDEGVLIGLPPNFRTETGALFVGTVVVVQHDDEGDVIDLSPQNIALVRAWVLRVSRVIRYEYAVPDPIVAFGPDWDNVRAEVAAKAALTPRVRLASIAMEQSERSR